MSRYEESFDLIETDHASYGFHRETPVNIKEGNVKDLIELLDKKIEIEQLFSIAKISFHYRKKDIVQKIPLKRSEAYSDIIIGYELEGIMGLKINIDDYSDSGALLNGTVDGDYELSQGITIKVASDYGLDIKQLASIVQWTGNSINDYYQQFVEERVI